MTPDQARELIARTLLDIVPDADLASVPADADIREALELDSLDFVVLVERLSAGAGFRIEEEDYARLQSVDSASAFLAARAG